MSKTVKTTASSLRAEHRERTIGLDLGTRVNAKPKGYTKAARRAGKNISLK